MREYRHFVTIAILLLLLLVIGLYASLKGVHEAAKIIIAALAGFALLTKAWIDKARGHTSWLTPLLVEIKAFLRARIERESRKEAVAEFIRHRGRQPSDNELILLLRGTKDTFRDVNEIRPDCSNERRQV